MLVGGVYTKLILLDVAEMIHVLTLDFFLLHYISASKTCGCRSSDGGYKWPHPARPFKLGVSAQRHSYPFH